MFSTVLQSLAEQRFKNMMDFMHSVKATEYFDDFDYSLIMRIIWNKIAEIEKALGHSDHKIFFTTGVEANADYGTVLNVILHSATQENVTAKRVLFMHENRLVVSSNVLIEEVKQSSSDVPAHGVYWLEAERLFKVNKHFDACANKAFKALYRSLAPRGDAVALRLLITTMQLGWRVEYRMYGKKILVTQFEFNKQ